MCYCCSYQCTLGLSSSAAAGISVAIAVPITAIITAIISVAIMYLCTTGSKRHNSNKQSWSPPPQDYESPVSISTTTTTGLEMKSNTAYGQVNYTPTQQTQGAVYDTVITQS